MRLSALTLAPVVAAGAYVVLTDETPTSAGIVYAGVDSTTSGTDPATPDPTMNGTPSAPTPGTSPTGEASRTPGPGGGGGSESDAPSSDPAGEDGEPDSPPDDPATPEVPPTPSTPGTPPVSRPPSPDDPVTSDPENPPSDPTQPSEPPDPTRPPDPTQPPDETPDDPIEPPEPDPTVSLPPDLTGAERELVEATNAERASAGCPDLRVDGALTSAARKHSTDMRNRLYVSHVSPDGSTPADRATEAGFDGAVGETIRYGAWDAERVVDRWMSHPDDRSKLLDCSYTSIGVGRESGLLGTWWTQVLGRA
ncbi:uncharacterized protein YkwD [Haloactinopolyspora alba]|uniref:Uncharacterized protein YkwD n=1 Tax=Haloactinopolyspora alba TaxID=648780 RepID=A0A2P8E779_9ACTN|nr:CAP domain-containing protein [Haloactinopolyspora alba]PSL05288.1 uncharacterized protein YkwD [Haloactinopolyspora alba]